MSLDCEIYDVNSNKIYSSLNGLGWIIIKYLHDKNYVPKKDIEKCSYTVKLSRAIILEITNELIKYFNNESSYYRDYEIDEAPNLGYVLGFLYQLSIFTKDNENPEIYLDANW